MARNNRPTNDQLDSKLNEIKKNVENYQALLDNYKTAFGDIETLSATIKTFDEDAKKITAIKSTMEKHQTNIEEIKDGIEEYHTELLSDEENETIKDKIEDVFNRIKGYEKELLEGDDSLSNQIKSIKDDLEKYKENWGAFEGQSKKDWETFKKERNTEYQDTKKTIESLLPNATTTGLAYSFKEAKSRYEFSPEKLIIKESEKPKGFNKKTWKKYIQKALSLLFKLIIHTMNNAVKWILMSSRNLFYYMLFILPLISIVLFSLFGLDNLQEIHKDPSMENVKGILASKDLFFMFLRMLVSLPFGFISWLGYLSIKENRRLYEEYNHKQRVMELYVGFKKEIESDKSIKHHKDELIKTLLDTVKKNPIEEKNKQDASILTKKGEKILNMLIKLLGKKDFKISNFFDLIKSAFNEKSKGGSNDV